MNKIAATRYNSDIDAAVELFWEIKSNQTKRRKTIDQGTRSSVTAGKHLDGFIHLINAF